jgi:hypothetical protein
MIPLAWRSIASHTARFSSSLPLMSDPCLVRSAYLGEYRDNSIPVQRSPFMPRLPLVVKNLSELNETYLNFYSKNKQKLCILT